MQNEPKVTKRTQRVGPTKRTKTDRTWIGFVFLDWLRLLERTKPTWGNKPNRGGRSTVPALALSFAACLARKSSHVRAKIADRHPKTLNRAGSCPRRRGTPRPPGLTGRLDIPTFGRDKRRPCAPLSGPRVGPNILEFHEYSCCRIASQGQDHP